ncbi:BTAD domain-containing putative transcriptional regulator [Nocardia sp. NPDC058114]|uniref:AfsR/SARP family transcriptional regulator n=1 Tax=Nocardia sp. NPDC058114 TaxID=3346346 RepID=UPI0036DB90D8
MGIQLLGPLEISIDGHSIVPSANKPRQVLALLAIRCGQVVPVSTLITELWNERPPRSAATTLQTYILHLRSHITAASSDSSEISAKHYLVTDVGGYKLSPNVGASDHDSFHTLTARAFAMREEKNYEGASALFSRALHLWRGPAFVDIRTGPVLDVEIVGLEEKRRYVLECRIDSELRLGRHSSLLHELSQIVADQPGDEKFCGQFMLALYRSGSARRALEAFQRLRQMLVLEMGIEPSIFLRRLHQAILVDDPCLGHTADYDVPIWLAS